MSTHRNATDPREAATRFFRAWLIGATVASILGNVTHALLNPFAGSAIVAAVAALVPPVIQLGMTWGVHMLMRSRITGGAYVVAVMSTAFLALIAFVLSFAALRDLMIVWAGMTPFTATLWPVGVDLSITGSTIALLALTNAQRVELVAEQYGEHVHMAMQPVHVEVHNAVHASAQAADLHVSEPATGPFDLPVHHVEAAERMLAEGVTRIDRVKVAEVLHEHAQGVAPSMIARKLSVGYTTVVRILEHHTAQPERVGV